MIKLTSLHNDEFVVNDDLIEYIESTPDTLITLTTGKRVMVLESIDDVVRKVIEFRQQIQPIKVRKKTVQNCIGS